jgi:ligand-binding sensor protein
MQREGEQMTLMDLKKNEEWESILNRFSQDAKMTACLIDDKGTPLICRSDRYPLCQSIRENQEAATFICSRINVAMLAVVKKTRRPEIDICDAGLMRAVVPIFRDDTFFGQIAACGLASTDEEIDSFLVAKQLGISEERVLELARSTPIGSEEEIRRLAERLHEELNTA